MIITHEDAMRRLRSPNNIVNSHVPPKVAHPSLARDNGRTGITNTPEFMRDIIGDIARVPGHESQMTIAAAFGVAPKTVSDYKTGGSSGKPATLERRAKIQEKTDRIHEAALEKLLVSIGCLTPDTIGALDAKGVSQVASNMARVVGSLKETDAHQGAAVSITVYVPQPRDEDRYKTVDV